MATAIQTLIQQFNDETNAIAARIDTLIAAASAGTAVTAEDLASLQAVSDRLKVLGTDPAAPIPGAPPVVDPGPAPAPVPDPTTTTP